MGITNSGTFHHVCFVVEDLEKAAQSLASTLSIKPWNVWTITPDTSTFRGREVATSFKIAIAPLGAANFELIQPISGENAYFEHLQTKGEGIHHTCIAYETLVAMQDARRELLRQGRTMIQSGSIEGAAEFCYFEIPETGSVLELLYMKELPAPEKTIE